MTKKNMTTPARVYNTIAIERLSVKYGLTPRFIRQCLKGDRTSETADTINSEYKAIVNKIETAIQ